MACNFLDILYIKNAANVITDGIKFSMQKTS